MQAHLGGYSDTIVSLPDVPTETAASKQRKDELLGKQLKDQVKLSLTMFYFYTSNLCNILMYICFTTFSLLVVFSFPLVLVLS